MGKWIHQKNLLDIEEDPYCAYSPVHSTKEGYCPRPLNVMDGSTSNSNSSSLSSDSYPIWSGDTVEMNPINY